MSDQSNTEQTGGLGDAVAEAATNIETAVADTPQEKPSGPNDPKANSGGFYWGTGRRKSSVARVRIKPGSGKFLINDREVDQYFTEPQHREEARAALTATKTTDSFDIWVNVSGGGITGQAGAVLLGLARAMTAYDSALEVILRDKNYLTRDPREVERKKPGQPGARRRFQFSKR